MPTHALPEATPQTFFSASIRYSPGTDDLRPLGGSKFVRTTGAYVNTENDDALGTALDAAGVPTYEVRYRGSGKTAPPCVRTIRPRLASAVRSARTVTSETPNMS